MARPGRWPCRSPGPSACCTPNSKSSSRSCRSSGVRALSSGERTPARTTETAQRQNKTGGAWPPVLRLDYAESSVVDQLQELIEDAGALVRGDRRRLHAAHQVPAAPRLAGRVIFLDDRLGGLDGGHLGEVVAAHELGPQLDQRLLVVPAFGILL